MSLLFPVGNILLLYLGAIITVSNSHMHCYHYTLRLKTLKNDSYTDILNILLLLSRIFYETNSLDVSQSTKSFY